ncbi:LacI family transcriptional regulator [Chloroflexia bacterium SDU3-3]|nr:LacI family transcriptional regulator [Chloroflexia bacterium SDU3-3]
MPTIEQIAALAKVSRSTVSRVLNNHPSVRPVVRDRVLQVMRTYKYVPHAAAQRLAGSSSHAIGLIIPREAAFLFQDPFFSQLLHGIAERCADRGYFLTLSIAGRYGEASTSYDAVLRGKRFDGVIMLSSDMSDAVLPELIRYHMPMVLIGRHAYAHHLNWVDAENRRGAYEAVSHLVGLGHRRIGLISGPSHMIVNMDRRDGYRQALMAGGLAIDPQLVVEGDFSQGAGFELSHRLLDMPQPPTAIFATSDALALGAIRAIHARGLRIPHDIALVGFDDLPIAEFSDPPLTTVRQPIGEMSMAAADLLIEQLHRSSVEARQICLPTELVIRESSGTVRERSVPEGR